MEAVFKKNIPFRVCHMNNKDLVTFSSGKKRLFLPKSRVRESRLPIMVVSNLYRINISNILSLLQTILCSVFNVFYYVSRLRLQQV